jgi:uncharacterized protein
MPQQAVVVAHPAEVDLLDSPIPANWVIEGSPNARARELAISADGASSIVAWSCTAGRFNWHYYVDETVHILSGEAFITDEKGRERRLGPGDMAFFPAGTHSVWYVPSEANNLQQSWRFGWEPPKAVLRDFVTIDWILGRLRSSAQADPVLGRLVLGF